MRPLPPLTPTFEAALRDASAKGMNFRMAAAVRLGDEPTTDREAALCALRKLSKDELGPIRAAALTSLGLLEDDTSLPLFKGALDDPDSGARQAAMEAAGRLRARGGLALIDVCLDDERVEMRFAAVAALVGAPAAQVQPRLLARLSDEDGSVRASAAEGLGSLADALNEDRVEGETVDSETVEALGRLLEDPLEDVGRTAALALAELGDPRGVPLLIGALQDRRFCLDAAHALGQLEAHEAEQELSALLDRPLLSPSLHAEAAGALCRLGSARGVEGLRRVFRALRSDGRSRAAELVGELGLRELMPELERLARRSRGASPEVVERALVQLRGAQETSNAEPSGRGLARGES